MFNQILDFLDNSFANINPGQQQIEIINQIINKNVSSLNELSENMFQSAGNRDEAFGNAFVYIDMWKKALGLVPEKTGEEKEELIEKCEALQKQCDVQKDTIKQLQDEKINDQKNEITRFKDLIEKQGSQFQDLINLSEKIISASPESQKVSDNTNYVQKKSKSSVKNKK